MKKLALLLVLFAFAACSETEVQPLPPIDGSGLQEDAPSESKKELL